MAPTDVKHFDVVMSGLERVVIDSDAGEVSGEHIKDGFRLTCTCGYSRYRYLFTLRKALNRWLLDLDSGVTIRCDECRRDVPRDFYRGLIPALGANSGRPGEKDNPKLVEITIEGQTMVSRRIRRLRQNLRAKFPGIIIEQGRPQDPHKGNTHFRLRAYCSIARFPVRPVVLDLCHTTGINKAQIEEKIIEVS